MGRLKIKHKTRYHTNKKTREGMTDFIVSKCKESRCIKKFAMSRRDIRQLTHGLEIALHIQREVV